MPSPRKAREAGDPYADIAWLKEEVRKLKLRTGGEGSGGSSTAVDPWAEAFAATYNGSSWGTGSPSARTFVFADAAGSDMPSHYFSAGFYEPPPGWYFFWIQVNWFLSFPANVVDLSIWSPSGSGTTPVTGSVVGKAVGEGSVEEPAGFFNGSATFVGVGLQSVFGGPKRFCPALIMDPADHIHLTWGAWRIGEAPF